ncbi:MAG: glycosyltransferase [Desulfobacterales bacterium]|nr:glycosyltransferase [Desulfobacterales bacterium]MDP6806682.1 glycosyltransferase [Desulfobacterales bacterium]
MKNIQKGGEVVVYDSYRKERISHWDTIAKQSDTWKGWRRYYHGRLKLIYRSLVSPNQNVLELGCGKGDLLAPLNPRKGVGVDFSKEMILRAEKRYPQIRFIHSDVHEFESDEKFDVIILSDLINDLWDVQNVLDIVRKISAPSTRLVINFYSRLWQIPLNIARALGIAKPLLPQNWLTVEDVENLMILSEFEIIRHSEEILLPINLPIFSQMANRYMVKSWPLKYLALTNIMVARPVHFCQLTERKPTVSIVVPARNEAGNISQIFKSTPELGFGTELIFVEGHSKDDTYKTVEKAIKDHPDCKCKLLKQSGNGKGDAVRLGFAHAEGDILMILDADLTVSPEDLLRFYDALVSSKGEFINGVRLVYPIENEAMRFMNIIGNKFFSLLFSWLLGQTIKDTLCGTKVLWKRDYDQISRNRSYFGDFDPFGDFDLLFGAAKLNLKIVDLPIRYYRRTYGNTNIQRWRHGLLLLRMAFFAARRIKFV